jgi:hypothetical protein
MNIVDTKNLSSNSLLPVSFMIMAFTYPTQNITNTNIKPYLQEKVPDVSSIFSNLPKQDITLEQSQVEVLASFVSKLVSESKDLDGAIVEMVNRNFEELLLKL